MGALLRMRHTDRASHESDPFGTGDWSKGTALGKVESFAEVENPEQSRNLRV